MVPSSVCLPPRETVAMLDRFIVGQTSAKRAMAVSLRNRWRRHRVTDVDMRQDITPKNILMIGPTGVGKTEIARRMAKLTDAPFVKVEATKYSEVGFRGKDVDSIIEDLYQAAKHKARKVLEGTRTAEAEEMAHHQIFSKIQKNFPSMTKEEYMEKMKGDDFDKVMITITITTPAAAPPRRFGSQTQGVDIFPMAMPPQETTLTKSAKEALPLLIQDSFRKLVDDAAVTTLAQRMAEEDGIVFIDEIDKVCTSDKSADVSAEGVQQDLLPIVEGSIVAMKDGTNIDTSGVLFICSGAFHSSKPSDMIAELQGRLPVRVELSSLNEEDFRRILTEPKYSILRQHQALFKTEGIEMEFAADAIDALAKAATSVNTSAQNIGARRLHTVLERVVDEYSFNCEKYEGQHVVITAETVRQATEPLMANIALAKYLL